MKRLLIVIILVGAGVAVLGFYREWFQFGSGSGNGKSSVTLSVDTDKIQEDRKAALTGVQKLGRKTEDKVAGKSHDGKSHDGKSHDGKSHDGKSHDGKVVSITGAKLLMTNMDGLEEHAHAIAADVKITCDGKACTTADLKSGMRIRVTTENVEPHAVTRIEALDDNPDYEKGT